MSCHCYSLFIKLFKRTVPLLINMSTPHFPPSEYHSQPPSETLEGLLSLNNHLLSENKQLRDVISHLRKDNKNLSDRLLHIHQISTVSPPKENKVFQRFFRKPWSES